MNQLSLMTYPFDKKKYSTDTVFKIAADSHIDYIDIFDIPEKEMKDYQQAMQTYPVKINVYIAWISAFNKEEKYLPKLEEAIQRATRLNANWFMIVPYTPFNDNLRIKGMKKEKIVNKEKIMFTHAVSIASKHGIKVCFETTPVPKLYLCQSDDLLNILNSVPDLHFIFDTANGLPSGEDPISEFKKLQSHISYVHLKDVKLSKKLIKIICLEYTDKKKLMNRCVLGEGVVPVSTIYHQLINDGYQGDFALEYVTPKENTIEANHKQLQKFKDALNA